MHSQSGVAILAKGYATLQLKKWEKKGSQAQANYTINFPSACNTSTELRPNHVGFFIAALPQQIMIRDIYSERNTV